jgi:hypothetical protein
MLYTISHKIGCFYNALLILGTLVLGDLSFQNEMLNHNFYTQYDEN